NPEVRAVQAGRRTPNGQMRVVHVLHKAGRRTPSGRVRALRVGRKQGRRTPNGVGARQPSGASVTAMQPALSRCRADPAATWREAEAAPHAVVAAVRAVAAEEEDVANASTIFQRSAPRHLLRAAPSCRK